MCRRNARRKRWVLRRDSRPRLSSRAKPGSVLALRFRRRLRPIFLQQRLEKHDDQDRQRKHHQQPALHPGFLLRIIKFRQISRSPFLRRSKSHVRTAALGRPAERSSAALRIRASWVPRSFASFANEWDSPHPSPPHPTRPSPTDGTATSATPPSFPRAPPHTVLPLPSHIPNTLARTGTTAETMAKSTAYKLAAARERVLSFLHQLFRDHIQRPPHFFEHHRKFQRQHRLLRIDHHINRARALQRRTPLPHCFAQPPLDSIPLH